MLDDYVNQGGPLSKIIKKAEQHISVARIIEVNIDVCKFFVN